MSTKQTLVLSVFALLIGTGMTLPVAARIACCEVDGKRTCGDPPPAQCTTRAQTVFSKGGTTKEIEAPLTAEQRAAREAEEARKKEEEKKAAEQQRKDRALMGSYSSEKDIDAARDRAITDIERNAEQAKNRLETALKKQQQLAQEKEFYQKKPLPLPLKRQIEENEKEISMQQAALAQKDTDIAAARDRYETDRQRYRQITGKAAVKN